MREERGVIYLKIDRNSLVTHPNVILSDIARIECENKEILRKLKYLPVYRFATEGKGKNGHTTIAMSVLKIIELIHKERPQVLVINEGESDFVIEYQKSRAKDSWVDKAKTVFLCVIIFFGSAFSIMAFNNDISITKMFDQFYYQVTGSYAEGVTILELSYCVGLAVGIMVFFNHIGPKKITHDPTPLQIEMRKYENDIDTTFIENADRKGHNIDVD